MTTKEYLQQAFRLDQRINSKIEQVDSLNELAMKCTSTISDMPKGSSRSESPLADTVVKIIDLQNEINSDIDSLIDLKRDIVHLVKSVENKEYQTLLEKRYLCYTSWEQIAVDMKYSTQYTFRMHERAVKEIESLMKRGE